VGVSKHGVRTICKMGSWSEFIRTAHQILLFIEGAFTCHVWGDGLWRWHSTQELVEPAQTLLWPLVALVSLLHESPLQVGSAVWVAFGWWRGGG
jgi:hypothetical protein